MKDREWSGLMKIPSDIVISELRQELGKLRSTIDELKYDIDEFKKINGELMLSGLKKASTIVRLSADIEKLEAEVKRQQKANTNLLKSIIKLKKKYET